MPAIRIKNIPALVYIWHITESLDKLLDLNSKDIQKQSLIYKSGTHRKQFLAKQLLLKELNLTDNISYLRTGKPVLSNGQYVSISHSGIYIGLAVSSMPIGIDIERNHPKLQSISKRFINNRDVSNKMINSNLQWIWTAKESIYKLAGIQGLSFKDDVIISHLNTSDFSGTALLKNQKIDLIFQALQKDYLFCLAFYNNSISKS